MSKSEIVIPSDRNSATSYLTPNSRWSTQWGQISGAAEFFTAFSHNSTVQYVIQSNGEIYHDWWYPDQGIRNSGVLRLFVAQQTSPNGGSAVGRPAAVALNPTTIMIMTRVSNNTLWFRTGGDDASGWDKSTWQRIPGTLSVGSSPVAVSRDPNHVAVFYKDTSSKVYVTEMAYGNWPSTPVLLGDLSLDSELTIVSRHPGHLAVFGVGADSHLRMREWTDKNKVDWSDTSWQDVTQLTGLSMKIQKPAVTIDGGRIYAQVAGTDNVRYWLEQTYDGSGSPTGWTKTELNSSPVTDSYTLASVDSADNPDTDHGDHTILRATLNSSGEIWANQLGSKGLGWSKIGTDFNPSEPPVLVAWGVNQAALIVKARNGNLYATTYTPGWESASLNRQAAYNMPVSALTNRNQMVFLKAGGTPYVAWLETGFYSFNSYYGPGGQVKLSSVDGARVKSPKIPHVLSDERDPQQFLLAADIDGSGDQALIVVRRENATALRVELHTVAGISEEWPLKWLGIDAPGHLDGAVAGDFNGDGVRNELVIIVRNGRTFSLYPAYYDYKGDQQFHYLQHSIAQASYDGDLQGSLLLSSGRFRLSSNGTPQEQVMVNLIYRARSGSYWQDLHVFDLSDDTDSAVLRLLDTKHMRMNDHSYMVASEAADVNGDGFDEVAVFHVNKGTYITLFDARVKDQIKDLSVGGIGGNFLHAGDLDGDGRDEVVAYNSAGKLTVFGQDIAATTNPGLRARYSLTNQNSLPSDRDFLVGDANNDSLQLVPATGDRASSCENLTETHVLAVINAPPRRSSNQDNKVVYGKSRSSGTAQGTSLSHTLGGSVTIGTTVEGKLPFVGGVKNEFGITQDFAFSWSKSRENSQTTSLGGNSELDNTDGLVAVSEDHYVCYYYRRNSEPVGTRSVQTCAVAEPPSTQEYPLEQWDSSLSQNPGWFDIRSQTSVVPGMPHSSLFSYYSRVGGSIPAAHKPTLMHDLSACANNFCNIAPISSAGGKTFTFEQVLGSTVSLGRSWETNTTVSSESEVGNAKFGVSFTFGFGGESTNSTTVENGFNVEAGLVFPVTGPAYRYSPYIYQATARTPYGASYPYLVLDYYCQSGCSAAPAAAALDADTPFANVANPSPQLVKPGTPVLTSPTHPAPATWVPTSTVTFNWSQPDNDPATIQGYDWGIYASQTITPTAGSTILTNTTTYQEVPDGVWTMSLWAQSDTGTLSDVATRTVRVDTHAPEVQINAPPANGQNGWHTQPFNVTLNANDDGPDGRTPGSGVQKIEYQLDNGGWLTYGAPLVFNTNTLTTTIWARATDQVGHVSEPISTSIKLDMTPPNSVDADGFWLSYAGVITDTSGNDWYKLGGQLNDNLSGRGSMMIADEAGQFHAADEIGLFPMPPTNEFTSTETTLNWFYTPTFSVHGVYDINGYGIDQAGNREEVSNLGEYSWWPDGQPDFQQTAVSIQPSPAYPGDVVNVVIAVRNSGTMESNLRLTETLPPGLSVVTDTISSEGRYLEGSNAVAWDVKAVWPGDVRYLNVSARVTLTPTTPTNAQHQLALEPYWPDASGQISQPAATQQSGQIIIWPSPAQGASQNVAQQAAATATASQTPLLNRVEIVQGDLVSDPDVWLNLAASTDTQSVLVREFTLNPATAEWNMAQESPWIPFEDGDTFFNVADHGSERSGMLKWSLSSGDGVKYLAVYLAGANGRVSSPNISGLVYTNLVSRNGQTLNAGERVQYRVHLNEGDLSIWNLVVFSGQADLYTWRPRFAQAPEYPSLGALAGVGFNIVVSAFTVEESGTHIVEVVAQEGPLNYRLAPAGDNTPATAALSNAQGKDANAERALADFEQPSHTPYEQLLAGEGELYAATTALPDSPLTLTIPLSGILQAVPQFIPSPTTTRIFIPFIMNNP